MTKPYRDGTTALAIICYGWSRDFSIEQTLEELTIMGHTGNRDGVAAAWAGYDIAMAVEYPDWKPALEEDVWASR